MKRDAHFLGLVVLGTAAIGVLAWTERAAAQARGQVLVTQTPPPKTTNPAAVSLFLKKNRVSVLTKTPGKQSWQAYVFAHLRSVPAADTLNLPQNSGRLHLAFYRQTRRRWIRDNVDDVTYRPGVKIMSFPYKITASLGLKVGTPYQIKITVLDAKNREVVLAVGNFKLK